MTFELYRGDSPLPMTHADRSFMHAAIRNDDWRTVVALIREEARNVNRVDVQGKSPLFVAAEFGRLEIATILLFSGAELTFNQHHSMEGKTPLMEALFCPLMTGLLLRWSKLQEINCVDFNGRSALDHAMDTRKTLGASKLRVFDPFSFLTPSPLSAAVSISISPFTILTSTGQTIRKLFSQLQQFPLSQ